jgi:hypothetical protein
MPPNNSASPTPNRGRRFARGHSLARAAVDVGRRSNSMPGLFENLAEILGEAAKSYLGFLGLLSSFLALIAIRLFRDSSEKVKVGIFILLFGGVVAFAVAFVRSTPSSAGDGHISSASAQTIPTEGPTHTAPLNRAPSSVSVTNTKADHELGKDCVSHQDFVVTCTDADTSRNHASVTILPCKAVRVIGIHVIEASGDRFRLPTGTSRFTLPRGIGAKYSKAEIHYESLVDNRTRVRSVFVDRSGICIPRM